jgi:hypothetical protein
MFAVVFFINNSTFIAEYSSIMQVGAVCCPEPQNKSYERVMHESVCKGCVCARQLNHSAAQVLLHFAPHAILQRLDRALHGTKLRFLICTCCLLPEQSKCNFCARHSNWCTRGWQSTRAGCQADLCHLQLPHCTCGAGGCDARKGVQPPQRSSPCRPHTESSCLLGSMGA